MPRITLPDGSVRTYDHSVTAADVAADIGPGLARDALGARIDGALSDLATLIEADAEISIVTSKDRSGKTNPDALTLMRHSCAHIMAEAIQRAVPGVELVYGPPLETGFYYDMYVPDGRPLSTDDFETFERYMAEIIAEDRPFTRYELPVEEGMGKLRTEGSKYKIDNAERAVAGGAATLSWYATGVPGRSWEDLCRGPHVPSTGRVQAFKVMSLASSYWHGDAASDQPHPRVRHRLRRLRQSSRSTCPRLEEAKQRDHRVLGRQLDLFHIDEAVGQGLILWKPNGRGDSTRARGVHPCRAPEAGIPDGVHCPHIGKLDLYRTSGHFPYYRDSQYPPLIDRRPDAGAGP